jgi:hypothetical protein
VNGDFADLDYAPQVDQRLVINLEIPSGTVSCCTFLVQGIAVALRA